MTVCRPTEVSPQPPHWASILTFPVYFAMRDQPAHLGSASGGHPGHIAGPLPRWAPSNASVRFRPRRHHSPQSRLRPRQLRSSRGGFTRGGAPWSCGLQAAGAELRPPLKPSRDVSWGGRAPPQLFLLKITMTDTSAKSECWRSSCGGLHVRPWSRHGKARRLHRTHPLGPALSLQAAATFDPVDTSVGYSDAPLNRCLNWWPLARLQRSVPCLSVH